MRVLQFTPRIAIPPSDGGRVAMLRIATSLAEAGAEVEVFSLNPLRQRVEAAEARQAYAPIAFDAVAIDTSAHFSALTRSLLMHAPYLVTRFFSSRAEAALAATLQRSRFDIVQVESPFLLPYLPQIRASTDAAVVLRSLNVEFRIWQRLADHERNVARRIAFGAIARSLRRYEIERANDCDALIPITESDATQFRALGCRVPIHVAPASIDPSALRSRIGLPSSIGFLASLDYRPNQEAALWICDELAGRLTSGVLHLAGSRAPAWLQQRIIDAGIDFRGEVPSAAEFIGGMQVMIAPIFSGGGMRIKILEAMAAARPVVATTIGAEGLDVVNGANIVIADDPETFAAAVEGLLLDPARAARIGLAGRNLVESRYSSRAIGTSLLRFYEELTKGRGVLRRH